MVNGHSIPHRLIAALSNRYPSISAAKTSTTCFDDETYRQCLYLTGTEEQLKQAGLITDELIAKAEWVNADARRRAITTEFGDKVWLITEKDGRARLAIYSDSEGNMAAERSVSSQRMAAEFRRIWMRVSRAKL